jgi:hypothetical protein
MSAHTPGPWLARWTTRQNVGQREKVNRCIIGTPQNAKGGQFVVAEIVGPFAGEAETAAANARLIAAAPALYAALQAIAAQAESGVDPLQIAQQARAALAQVKES